MSAGKNDIGDLCARLEPWIVLAAGTLISACYARNFSTIELLKTPIRVGGTTADGIAAIDLPRWFPIQEAVLDVADGAIHAKVKELALPVGSQKLNEQAMRVQIDLRRAPLPPGPRAFTLTYSPWFRFLAEPISYDIVGRTADYIAGVFRFLFVRHGIGAEVSGNGDSRTVRSAAGLEIEVAGMASLRGIALTQGSRRTSLDLTEREINIDRAMFPAAYTAGAEMLKTSDRLANLDAALTDTHLRLSEMKGAGHV